MYLCTIRFVVLLAFFPLTLLAQPDSNLYSVKAFLPQWNGVQVELSVEGQIINRGIIQKDMYSYSGTTHYAKTGVLRLKKEGRSTFLPIFIEPGTIKVRDEGRQLLAYGTPLNESYRALIKKFDSAALAQKGLAFIAYRNVKRNLTQDFITRNPSSILGLKLLDDFFYKDGAADDTLYYALFTMLDPILQQSFLGRRIGTEAAQRAATAVGKIAPMLQLADTANRRQPIYGSGQYTLINFWASWCLPCRKEHPQLVKLYNQYRDRGFTIRGVSLDQNRSAWLAAIKKEGLVWTQLVDKQAFESKVVKQYGVQVVPTNFLLDPSGIIIDRNINTDILAVKLAELLQNNLPKPQPE